MSEVQLMDEDITETVPEDEDGEEDEVMSYVENDIVLFKTDSIVLKSLITNKVKKSLKKTDKSLKTITKVELKETNYLIRISGEDRNRVIETKMKLNQLLAMAKRNRPFTHLVTVPFKSEQIRQEFNKFKDNVLTNFKDCNGIDENLFQRDFKLHLTICVLVLLNQNEIIAAKRVLQKSLDQIVKPVLGDRPLKISVEGLDVIKGGPNRAHVLYAKIKDESNRLQSIADLIVRQYIRAGLLEECDDFTVKLHITFMNSLFRQRFLSKTLPKTSRSLKRQPFDAQPIIDFYNSYKFNETVVKNIQLNDIKTKTEDGFYGLVESIDFPEQ